MHINLLTPFIGVLLKPFRSLFREGFRAVFRWTFIDSPRVLRIFGAILVIFAGVLTYELWSRTSTTSGALLKALSETQEPTPETFKGLEGFLLAGLNDEIDKDVTSQPLVESVRRRLEQVDSAAISEIDKTLDVIWRKGRFFLTDQHEGFLFVPQNALRKSLNGEVSAYPSAELSTTDAIVVNDIRWTQSVAKLLCDFQDSPIVEKGSDQLKPIQAYAISRTGVIRICEMERGPSWTEQRDYYQRQFEPTTFFPGRPYFEQTIKFIPSGTTVGGFFYATRLYIDLGGNGFVKTLCHRVKAINGGSDDAIICLDLRLSRSAESAVRRRIDDFGGDVYKVRCDSTGCGDPVDPTPSQVISHLLGFGYSEADQELLKRALKSESDSSEVFGKLHVYEGSGAGQGPLVFSIPTGVPPDKNQGPGQRVSLLYSKMDLSEFQRRTSWLAAVTGGAWFSVLLVTLLVIADYGLRLNEQELAFKNVATVMENAPVAYCHVGADNKFVDYNEAFAKLLGFASKEPSLPVLKGQRFVDLLADDGSKNLYEQIQESRQRGVPTKPYPVRLKRLGSQDEKKIAVVVHGADVPGPRNPRNERPQTFGIVLEDRGSGAEAGLRLVNQ